MPKPKKDRFVLQPPSVVYFKPQGIPLFQLDQVVRSVDEYEAIRLMDYESLQQVEAAQRMKVSRATCARILESAHRKIAAALTEGKAIRIEGGNRARKSWTWAGKWASAACSQDVAPAAPAPLALLEGGDAAGGTGTPASEPGERPTGCH